MSLVAQRTARSGDVEVWAGPSSIPPQWRGAVVLLGVFDGVHRGHLALFEHARGVAQVAGGPVVMTTFDPHPATIAGGGRDVTPLVTLPRRARLAAELGVDAILVVPFDAEVAEMAPKVFVTEVLVDSLAATHVVVGSGFRFGHGARGNEHTLRELGSLHGFGVSVLPRVGGFSSTRVRQLLRRGCVEEAAVVLGRPHQVQARVVASRLEIDEGMVPAPGRYQVAVNGKYACSTLLGTKLIGLRAPRGERVTVDFIRRC